MRIELWGGLLGKPLACEQSRRSGLFMQSPVAVGFPFIGSNADEPIVRGDDLAAMLAHVVGDFLEKSIEFGSDDDGSVARAGDLRPSLRNGLRIGLMANAEFVYVHLVQDRRVRLSGFPCSEDRGFQSDRNGVVRAG